MAARTFTDSAGLTWEVFEVHRASQKPGAVSPGLENGWLAFACGETKRRLAPFPAEWETASADRLEELCSVARLAPPPRPLTSGPLRPRLRREVAADTSDDDGPLPDEEVEADEDAPPPSGDVESAVRDFAHEARSRGLPAVAAMLELKALLQRDHALAVTEASDRRSVRRWFVEAYYFERDV